MARLGMARTRRGFNFQVFRARLGKAGHGPEGQGLARHGKDKARFQFSSFPGLARHSAARRGAARPGSAWQGKGKAGFQFPSFRGMARRGVAKPGEARPGPAGQGNDKARFQVFPGWAGLGRARRGRARQGQGRVSISKFSGRCMARIGKAGPGGAGLREARLGMARFQVFTAWRGAAGPGRAGLGRARARQGFNAPAHAQQRLARVHPGRRRRASGDRRPTGPGNHPATVRAPQTDPRIIGPAARVRAAPERISPRIRSRSEPARW